MENRLLRKFNICILLRKFFLLAIFLLGGLFLKLSIASALPLLEDFDGLGDNEVLLERARDLRPEKRIEVVQGRVVARNKRFELAPGYTAVLGGDTYNRTQMVGGSIYYHHNPYFGIAYRFDYAYNHLTEEAVFLLNDRSISDRGIVPSIDFPKYQNLLLAHFYPFYGKINFLGLGVSQFDFYGLGGGGQITLASGATNTYLAGGGVSFWLSRYLSFRAEVSYQNYTAQRSEMGESVIHATLARLQMGLLL